LDRVCYFQTKIHATYLLIVQKKNELEIYAHIKTNLELQNLKTCQFNDLIKRGSRSRSDTLSSS